MLKSLYLPFIIFVVCSFLFSSCKKDESREHFSNYPQQFASGGEIAATGGLHLKSGGYIIAGTTESLGENGDFFAVKTGASLNQEFANHFGGNGRDVCQGITGLRDGSIVLCGSTDSLLAFSATDMLVARTDAGGNLLWMHQYGGAEADEAHAVAGTRDGGMMVLASTLSYAVAQQSLMIWKLDVNGDSIFTHIYDLGANTEGVDILATPDSNFVILANQQVGAGNQFVVMKIRENGDMAWSFNFSIEDQTFAKDIDTVGTEGFIVTGATATGNEESSIFLSRIDFAGNEIWQQILGGQREDKGLAVNHVSGNSFVVTGSSLSWGNVEPRAFIIHTKSSGEQDWFKNYDRAFAATSVLMAERSDGGFTLGGTNPENGVFMMRTDAKGELIP